MLSLTQPKWQASNWCGMYVIVKGLRISLLFSLAGKTVRRGSVLGVGEHCSSVCCYLGWLFGFCRWLALMMLWVGFSSPDSWYLLKRFLRDHPKNKPASSKVYSVRAWSWKLAPILLSFPVKCICFLLMLQLFVVMGPLWPFSMPWVLHGPWGRAKKEPEPQCKEHERGKMPWWQGLAGFGKSGRSCFMPPSWLQGPAGVQQGWKGDALLLLHASLPLHFTCGIGAYPGLHSWARLEKQSPALCLTE